MACGAGGVAKPGCGVFIEGRPGEIAIRLGKPGLIGDGAAQARLRHVRRIRKDHETLDGHQPIRNLLHERHEGEIEEHHAVLRMIDV